ncbi:MAG: substrate-binding domain-containing protein [Burkholderiaceae bacterium]|nr:substrate-binding domain-containing protein [Burkholderiaceae bacterium]MDH3460297.1 substrate-binding domain-containing protein [Burkholderiaceae bacterium]
MTTRRVFVVQIAALAPCCAVWARPVRLLDNPLRVGVERALFDGGLAKRLQRAFARDAGIAVQIVPGASSGLLEALERGELDATLTHAPAIEARLKQLGLAQDGRCVAQTDFVIAGPLRGGLTRSRDATATLSQIAQRGIPFLTRNDGSGTHLAEQALWRAAGVAPTAPWYQPLDGEAGTLVLQAKARGACALIDRASLLAGGRLNRSWGVLAKGDPRLVTRFCWLRGFRSRHPAAKLFGQWIVRRQGRAVVADTPGYDPVT